MAATSFSPNLVSGRRIPLAEIDAVVSARLGPTRGLGNSQPACFYRQVAMYLASRVGRWSTKIIGRFYGGRDHSTVCHGIQRIEAMCDSDPDLDALISDIRNQICGDQSIQNGSTEALKHKSTLSRRDLEELADLIADMVCERLWSTAVSDSTEMVDFGKLHIAADSEAGKGG